MGDGIVFLDFDEFRNITKTNQKYAKTKPTKLPKPPIHCGKKSHHNLLLDLGDLLNALHQGSIGGIDLPQHGKAGQAEDADGACRYGPPMATTFQLKKKKKLMGIDGTSWSFFVWRNRTPIHQPGVSMPCHSHGPWIFKGIIPNSWRVSKGKSPNNTG